jgi:hypothetical protein
MLRPLGTVPARQGVNSVVGPSIYSTVLVAHFGHAGPVAIERDHTGDEARQLADLLDEAASFINGFGTYSVDRDEIGTVRAAGTDSTGPTEVRVLWPRVEMYMRHADGTVHLGLEYTPGNAADFARLLREAADELEARAA